MVDLYESHERIYLRHRLGMLQLLETFRLCFINLHGDWSEDFTQVFDCICEEVALVCLEKNTFPSQRLKDYIDVLDVLIDVN